MDARASVARPGPEHAGRGVRTRRARLLRRGPEVRIVVLPGDPSSQPVPAENPESVVPKVMTVGGHQFSYHGIVRGMSSGYVGYTIANEGRAVLGQLGAGWNEPGAASIFSAPTAIESRVLLVEDVAKWPDEKGVEDLALRFAARIDLAFGGRGTRHLDRGGPEPER